MKREVDTGDAHYSVGLVDEGLPDVALPPLRQGLTHGDEPAKLHPGIGGAGLVEESDAAGVGVVVGVGGAGPCETGAGLLHDHLGARQVSRLAVGNNDGRDLRHSGHWGGRERDVSVTAEEGFLQRTQQQQDTH